MDEFRTMTRMLHVKAALFLAPDIKKGFMFKVYIYVYLLCLSVES